MTQNMVSGYILKNHGLIYVKDTKAFVSVPVKRLAERFLGYANLVVDVDFRGPMHRFSFLI
jgi:hypothetical protein